MASTFNPDLSDDVSMVRFHLGDTDMASPELQDATITTILLNAPNSPISTLHAAAKCARALAAKYAGIADVNVDDQMTRASQLYKNFSALAIRLQAEADSQTGISNAATAPYPGIMVTGVGDERGPLWYDPTCPPSWQQ
jgi:uncharacterized iron-regulated protein